MKQSVSLVALVACIGLMGSVSYAAGTLPAASPAKPAASATVKPKKVMTLTAKKEALKLTDDIPTAKAQVAAHPDDPEAHFLLAVAYSRSPYLEQAFKEVKTVKNMLKVNKDFEFIDRTLVQYEDLYRNHPQDTVVMFRLAMGYYLKAYSLEKYPHHYANAPVGTAPEFYEKAKTVLNQIITLNPNDIWSRNYLGVIVSENGKELPKAISIWEESLNIDTQHNPGAYLLLSQAYLKQGDLQKALTYGAKGLEVKQAMGMTLP